MSKICSADEAVKVVQPGDTVACVGVIGWITPEMTLAALARRFRETGGPRDCTFYFPCGTGDAMDIKGMDQVAIEGLMKRIVSGSYINPVDPKTGERPRLMQLINANKIEAYAWPIGASMQWLREVARRSPGYLTKVGLGTYADPRQEGARLNERTEENLVKVVEFEGQEYLFYPAFPLHVGFIRGASADEFGNISFEDEPIHSSSLQIALAVKACGGKVIAQVRRIVPRGERQAPQVKIPGALVDHVVVDPDQMMVTDTPYDVSYLGGVQWDGRTNDRLPFGPDKIIARRGAREIEFGVTTIFGFGASTDIPLVLQEEGRFENNGYRNYQFTTEHGPHGGLVMNGWQFSANKYPEALLDGVTQFDFINGGGCKVAALSFAEFDSEGNVNVSKFGKASPGAGGFTDIAYNAGKLIFTGTFSTGGLQIAVQDGKLRIVSDGKVRKLVHKATQITYPVMQNVRERGQEAMLITERAVFQIRGDGFVLTEVAPGIDVRSQVLGAMDIQNMRVADDLKTMDSSLFVE